MECRGFGIGSEQDARKRGGETDVGGRMYVVKITSYNPDRRPNI